MQNYPNNRYDVPFSIVAFVSSIFRIRKSPDLINIEDKERFFLFNNLSRKTIGLHTYINLRTVSNCSPEHNTSTRNKVQVKETMIKLGLVWNKRKEELRYEQTLKA